jgi:hypothetical protein
MDDLEIKITLTYEVPESGLTFNGLVRCLEVDGRRILLSILEAMLEAIEKKAIEALMSQSLNRYVRNGHQRNERKLITPFGTLRYRMAQVRDRQTCSTVIPLARALCIRPYKHYQGVSLEAGMGQVIHVSFRQAAAEVERIRGDSPSKSTLHRWVQEIGQCRLKWPQRKGTPFRFLMADETKVHLQRGRGQDLGQRSMRWIMASTGVEQPFELIGAWIDTPWAVIRNDLEKRINYQTLRVLFSDGDLAIAGALLDEGMELQRCLIHGKRDFPYILYEDGYKKPQQMPLREKLEKIPVFHLTKDSLEAIEATDLERIRNLAEKTRVGFEELIEALDPSKYPKARTYVENLYRHTMTFLGYWMENAEWIPLNTNAIESAFGRVKNRIKRIGRRWSQEGLLRWLKLAYRKIFRPSLWDSFWKRYLKLNPSPRLVMMKLEYRWR